MALEQLTPIALILDKDARERLQKASEALRNGQVDEACIEAAIAFHGGTNRVLRTLLGRTYEDLSQRAVRELFREIGGAAGTAAARARSHDHAVQDFARSFEQELRTRNFFAGDIFEPLERLVIFSGFGIAPSELRRFEEVVPGVLFSVGGEPHVTLPTRNWPPTAEAAAYSVDFAARAMLKLEGWSKLSPQT